MRSAAPFTARRCCASPPLRLRLAFGEMAEATILESERVVPARLSAAGFHFEYPELDSCSARGSGAVKRMIYVGRA